jgi:hypothetical protein
VTPRCCIANPAQAAELAGQLQNLEQTVAGLVEMAAQRPMSRRRAAAVQQALDDAQAVHQRILAELAAFEAAELAAPEPAPTKWTKQDVQAAVWGGEGIVPAYVYAVWAVHRQIGYKGAPTKLWRVTHVPTGGSITPWGVRTMKRGKEVVHAIIAADPRYATVQTQDEFIRLNQETPIRELVKSYEETG